jgi:hypothetical protein
LVIGVPWHGWERGAVPMAWVARQGGDGGAQVGDGRGKGDPQLVGRLGLLAAQWIGLKVTGPEGMRVK